MQKYQQNKIGSNIKESKYYKVLKDDIVQCTLCPKFCTIRNNERGNCGVRINKSGVIYSLVYSKPCSIAIDPVEKKPLHHFIPGSTIYSIGTAGCSLHCLFCQNFTTSQAKPEDIPYIDLPPEEAVKDAIANGCKSIAFTYNEPTIFFEYALDTMKLAKKARIKTVIVSDGFINPGPLKEWCKYLDAANIDLKAFNEKFYKEICDARLKPVLESLKILKENNVHIEITTLLIPGLNDNFKEIEEMCKWIKDNLGNIPLHFSRFFPMYKMLDKEPTPLIILIKAARIAKKYLDFVYIGNVQTEEMNNTYCPSCKKILIERIFYQVIQNKIKGGKCECGQEIPGIW